MTKNDLDKLMSKMTVMDIRTGKVSDKDRSSGKLLIAQGQAIETTPSDPEMAAEWRAELRSAVVREARRLGWNERLAGFIEFERWTKVTGKHALPVTLENLVLFMLHLADRGELDAHISEKAKGVEAIAILTAHPPRNVHVLAMKAMSRAREFAKLSLRQESGIVSPSVLDERAAGHALTMYPDGAIPARWADVAA